jgi:hypothetical protein
MADLQFFYYARRSATKNIGSPVMPSRHDIIFDHSNLESYRRHVEVLYSLSPKKRDAAISKLAKIVDDLLASEDNYRTSALLLISVMTQVIVWNDAIHLPYIRLFYRDCQDPHLMLHTLNPRIIEYEEQDPTMSPKLVKTAMQDPSPINRVCAIYALRWLSTDVTVFESLFLNSVSNNDIDCIFVSLFSLANFSSFNVECVLAISALLKQSPIAIQREGLRALKGIGGAAEAAAPFLIDILQDGSFSEINDCISILANIGEPAAGASAVLMNMVDELNSVTNTYIGLALSRIRPLSTEVIILLVHLLTKALDQGRFILDYEFQLRYALHQWESIPFFLVDLLKRIIHDETKPAETRVRVLKLLQEINPVEINSVLTLQR